ncbi:MAG: FadR family transcriptional regulator [Thermoguttaceae bacterium]|nr:FadR family transcriptional regulator [Thermoguttaceae bacterium]
MSVSQPFVQLPLVAEKPSTLVDQIAQGLIRYIAAKGLRPGDRLPSERELVRMVGASRLPLREAISVLKGLGVLEVKHGKGIFVRRLDLSTLFGKLSPLLRVQGGMDLPALFEVRMHLETSIAQIAASRRESEHLERLQASVEAMQDTLEDRPSYVRHDMAFHQELARATGNPIFHVLMATIGDLLCELQFMYRDSVEIRRLAIAEHQAILEAVRQGQPEQARQAMLQHLQNAIGRVERKSNIQ